MRIFPKLCNGKGGGGEMACDRRMWQLKWTQANIFYACCARTVLFLFLYYPKQEVKLDLAALFVLLSTSQLPPLPAGYCGWIDMVPTQGGGGVMPGAFSPGWPEWVHPPLWEFGTGPESEPGLIGQTPETRGTERNRRFCGIAVTKASAYLASMYGF